MEVTPSFTFEATSFTVSTALATTWVVFFATLRAAFFARRFTLGRGAAFFDFCAEARAGFRFVAAFFLFAGFLLAAFFAGRRAAAFAFLAGAFRLPELLRVDVRFRDDLFFAVAILN